MKFSHEHVPVSFPGSRKYIWNNNISYNFGYSRNFRTNLDVQNSTDLFDLQWPKKHLVEHLVADRYISAGIFLIYEISCWRFEQPQSFSR